MSKITKLLVMLLALVMVVSLVAGCKPATQIQQGNNNNQNQNNNNNNNEQNTTQTPTTLPEAEDEFKDARIIWNDIFPLEQPMTFTMAARGEKDYQTLVEKCEWYKYLCEKTNVYLEVITLGTDYASKR